MNTILGPVPLPKMAVYAFHKDSRIREAATLERDHERKRWDKGREDDGGSLARSLQLQRNYCIAKIVQGARLFQPLNTELMENSWRRRRSVRERERERASQVDRILNARAYYLYSWDVA